MHAIVVVRNIDSKSSSLIKYKYISDLKKNPENGMWTHFVMELPIKEIFQQ